MSNMQLVMYMSLSLISTQKILTYFFLQTNLCFIAIVFFLAFLQKKKKILKLQIYTNQVFHFIIFLGIIFRTIPYDSIRVGIRIDPDSRY